MSYSVVEGARFYGIGNEYMGVAIGAACVLFGLSGARPETDSPRSRSAQILGFAALFLALTWEMGVYGAKVGAIPSAGTAFGVTLLVWKRGRLGLKEIGIVLLLAAIGLGLLAAFDARHAAGDQTHFIRALTGAGGGSLPGNPVAQAATGRLAAAAQRVERHACRRRSRPRLDTASPPAPFAARRPHAALLGIGARRDRLPALQRLRPDRGGAALTLRMGLGRPRSHPTGTLRHVPEEKPSPLPAAP